MLAIRCCVQNWGFQADTAQPLPSGWAMMTVADIPVYVDVSVDRQTARWLHPSRSEKHAHQPVMPSKMPHVRQLRHYFGVLSSSRALITRAVGHTRRRAHTFIVNNINIINIIMYPCPGVLIVH